MYLSIDIGSRHIHLIEGEYKNKRIRVQNIAKVLTPEGTMGDGEILNQSDLITKLRNAIYQNQMKAKKVILTINPASVVSKTFTIPKVKSKEILPVLTNHVSSALALTEPYVVDYTAIKDGEKQTLEAEVLALPESIVEGYNAIIQQLGLTPFALDLHQNSMAKYIETCRSIDNKNIIVADIGNSFMNIFYYKNKEPGFSRRCIINTEEYENTLVSLGVLKGLNGEFKELNLSPHVLAGEPIINNTISLYLNNIVEQIQRVVEFQISRGMENRVEAIYLCGGMANMKGLDEHLAMQLELPVSHINAINTIKDRKITNVGDYANALGALMREK